MDGSVAGIKTDPSTAKLKAATPNNTNNQDLKGAIPIVAHTPDTKNTKIGPHRNLYGKSIIKCSYNFE